MGETKKLIAKCQELSFDGLSTDVVNRVKYLFKDFIGVAVRGMQEDSAIAMNSFVKSMGHNSQSMPVLGTDFFTHPVNAALATGTAAHSIELDDVINESSLHPAVAIMPAALAASFISNCSGQLFIKGIVLGYEVMSRLGIALQPTAHYSQGFHPTGTCGTMGAAIAAAKILGLSNKAMGYALGIAGSQAAGSMEFLTDGTMTKRLHPGWAAHSGVMAALMAREGFSGPETVLEGRFGFLHAYSPDSKIEKLLDTWGAPFQVMRASIKPHACCRYMQGPIDGIIQLMKKHDLKEKNIKKVTLGILKTGFPLVVDPLQTKMNPKSIVDAQFSMPFGAAVAIVYGRAFLDQFTMENLKSQKIKKVMEKVHCVSDPNLETQFPKKWKASVTIETTEGQQMTQQVIYPKGDPENALTDSELDDKFQAMVKTVYNKEKITAITHGIKNLDQCVDLKALILNLSIH